MACCIFLFESNGNEMWGLKHYLIIKYVSEIILSSFNIFVLNKTSHYNRCSSSNIFTCLWFVNPFLVVKINNWFPLAFDVFRNINTFSQKLSNVSCVSGIWDIRIHLLNCLEWTVIINEEKLLFYWHEQIHKQQLSSSEYW